MKETANFEQSEYETTRRQESINTPATYVMFERLMQQVDEQRMTRQTALSRAPALYQGIMEVEA